MTTPPNRELTPVEQDGLRVACPECKQPRNTWCVYMPIVMADAYSRRPSVQARLARVGTPTKKLHNSRTLAGRLRRYRRKAPTTPRPPADLLAAQRACRRADYRDYLRLALWLRQNGSIFDISPTESESHAYHD